MPFGWIAAATVASSLLSADAAGNAADTQASAARDAANTQAAASGRSIDAQQQMFQTINDQQAPYRQAGNVALSQLGSTTGPGGFLTAQSPAYNPYPAFTPYKDFNPYPDYKPFTAADLTANLAPNYAFQLEQGLNATKNAGNLQTGLLGGNTLRAVNDYAQNYAKGAYQDAFNNYVTNYNTGFNANQQNYQTGFNANQQNYQTGFNANKDNYLTGFNANQTQQSNIFNRLAAIAGIGQTSNGQVANSGTALAGNIGTASTAAGNGIAQSQLAGGAAQAAGQVGVANAISGGVNNAASWYSLPSLLNYGRTAPSVGAPSSAGDYYTGNIG